MEIKLGVNLNISGSLNSNNNSDSTNTIQKQEDDVCYKFVDVIDTTLSSKICIVCDSEGNVLDDDDKVELCSVCPFCK